MTPLSMLTATLLAIRLMSTGPLIPADPAYGTYAWPVVGAVIRGFEPPPNPYAPGHRGIDIAVPYGTSISASQDGTVAFAGSVAGYLFISIDHPDGVRTTYSWVSRVDVKKGDPVAMGETIGASGWGHPNGLTPHLHFGAKVGADYIDPMLLLQPQSVVDLIHLAPLDEPASELPDRGLERRGDFPAWPDGSGLSTPRMTGLAHSRSLHPSRPPPGTVVPWRANPRCAGLRLGLARSPPVGAPACPGE